MSMREDVKAAEKAGLRAEMHWWDAETWRKGAAAIEEALADDPKAIVCLREGLRDGVAVRWLYVRHSGDRAEATTRSHDDDGFNESHPCPPFYPPEGPPCP